MTWRLGWTLLLWSGCASHASRHGAAILPPGQWQTAVALDALVFEHGRSYAVYPAPEVALRRGLDGWDFGGKLGAGSLELSARLPGRQCDGLAAAWVPGMRVAFAMLTNNDTDLLRATGFGHLVVEASITDRMTAVVTATAAFTVAGPAVFLATGGQEVHALAEPALGFGLRLPIGGRILWPEVTATLPVALDTGVEPPLAQLGVALEL